MVDGTIIISVVFPSVQTPQGETPAGKVSCPVQFHVTAQGQSHRCFYLSIHDRLKAHTYLTPDNTTELECLARAGPRVP